MKTVKNISYYLLAIPYLALGINYFYPFIEMPSLDGNAGMFMQSLYMSGYLTLVKILELIFALMLVFNIQRPLALILLAPISLNILLFELFMAGSPGPGVLLVILTIFLIYTNREKYFPIVK